MVLTVACRGRGGDEAPTGSLNGSWHLNRKLVLITTVGVPVVGEWVVQGSNQELSKEMAPDIHKSLHASGSSPSFLEWEREDEVGQE